jgi:hypothetical protein
MSTCIYYLRVWFPFLCACLGGGGLRQVGSKCWIDIDRHFKGEISASVWFGPGYACYVVCLFGAFMRALFHWLTPIPGGRGGCTPKLPQSLLSLLDEDGDGLVTWAEVKKAYPRLVAARNEQLKQAQLRKEETWSLAKKNGPLMVKMNAVGRATLLPLVYFWLLVRLFF